MLPRVANILLAGFLLLAILSQFVQYWLLDIYVSFTPQVVIVLGLGYLLFASAYIAIYKKFGSKRAKKLLSKKELKFGIFAATGYIALAAYSLTVFAPHKVINDQPNLKVATYNVLYSNSDIGPAAEYFKQNGVEILALQEARPEFVEQTKNVLGYNYVEITDCDCSAKDTEVAIVSKYPLSNAKAVIQHQNGGVLRAEAQIDQDTKVAVYAVHIPPPFNEQWYLQRNDFTMRLAEFVEQDQLPTIMMGDFNTTVFSPSLKTLIDKTDSKISNVATTRWPECSWYGFGVITCARIDHVFVPKEFTLTKTYINQGFGSDHRPVIAELKTN
jgi:endonuclease/exonuclease/phosphatase (EEP) superfamily protein YafD